MKHQFVTLLAALTAVLGTVVLTHAVTAEEVGQCGVYKYCEDECPVDLYGACVGVMPQGCCIEGTDCDTWFPDFQCFGEMDTQVECYYDQYPSPDCISH